MLRRQVLASCLYGSVLSVSFFILRCVYYFFFFSVLTFARPDPVARNKRGWVLASTNTV